MIQTIPLLLLIAMTISCNNANSDNSRSAQVEKLQMEIDDLNAKLNNNTTRENPIATFLTFQDMNAETAMNFYMEIFEDSKTIKVQRWEKGGPVEEGKIMHAIFELNGSLFMVSDSPPIHDWDFSPAVSNYIDCDSVEEQERLFTKLSENGEVTMPLNDYGFSTRFGWVIDQFGISWQLNVK